MCWGATFLHSCQEQPHVSSAPHISQAQALQLPAHRISVLGSPCAIPPESIEIGQAVSRIIKARGNSDIPRDRLAQVAHDMTGINPMKSNQANRSSHLTKDKPPGEHCF